MNINDVAKCVAMYNLNPSERIGITKFKSLFAERWGIFEGATVLEVGCGQGDMTAVLAEFVGNNGLVIATDVANADYGSPISIGEAADFLSRSRLGSQIEFHLDTNICDVEHFHTDKLMDFVVLSHCSYYFGSQEDLLRTFINAKRFGKKVCFSEWDILASNLSQITHMLAVFIQGQVESFKSESIANIKSPFSKQEIESLLDKSGWVIVDDFQIASSKLQEYASWEVEICLDNLLKESQKINLPQRMHDVIRWQIDALSRYKKNYSVEPLPSYSLVAKSK